VQRIAALGFDLFEPATNVGAVPINDDRGGDNVVFASVRIQAPGRGVS